MARTSAVSATMAGAIGPLTRIAIPMAIQNASDQPQARRAAGSSRLIRTRARAAMQAPIVAVSTASVFARRASTPSRMTPATRLAAMNAALRVVNPAPAA